MDRLQLISVIVSMSSTQPRVLVQDFAGQTTFFASTEAGLLQITAPASGITHVLNAANAGIIGALILHSFAGMSLYLDHLNNLNPHGRTAIISFLASFVLVRYRLIEAKKKELKVERITGSGLVKPPSSSNPHDIEKNVRTSSRDDITGEPIHSYDPRLEQVGPFSSKQLPTALLSRCHSLCIFLAAMGFVLVLMGILCYAWAVHPLSVAVFSSVIMTLCLISGATILM